MIHSCTLQEIEKVQDSSGHPGKWQNGDRVFRHSLDGHLCCGETAFGLTKMIPGEAAAGSAASCMSWNVT
jgi:hypothetical protein